MCFDSKLVRLKVASDAGSKAAAAFRFQTGSIKSLIILAPSESVEFRFDSKLVRLKASTVSIAVGTTA